VKNIEERLNSVKEYYGRVLQTTKDLQTNACCPTDAVPPSLIAVERLLEPEILDKFYGCGSPIPQAPEGCVVLDLGCGTGRDVYITSRLVGEKGKVIGVDMTDEQLAIARKYITSHTRRFGYSEPNVAFKKSYIEDLSEAGIADNSVDMVISNCVINLSPDKQAVFAEIFRVLKPGGELFFSDIFAGRRIPAHHQSDPVLLGECLAGSLYIEDFRRLLRDLGCMDYRVFTKRKVTIDNPEIRAKIGMIDFYSMTIRAFKLDSLEDICEDYGQVALYLGTMAENPHEFMLDDHHIFKTGKPMLVCGNTATMLQETRFGKFFNITGDRSTHFGPFPCSTNSNTVENSGSVDDNSCC
jgi:arsenite methyltransferase